jgi:hypothetical protein
LSTVSLRHSSSGKVLCGPAVCVASEILIEITAERTQTTRFSPISSSPPPVSHAGQDSKRAPRREPYSPERVMGFEPTTVCLGSRYATTASHPRIRGHYSPKRGESQMPGEWSRICSTGVHSIRGCAQQAKVLASSGFDRPSKSGTISGLIAGAQVRPAPMEPQ